MNYQPHEYQQYATDFIIKTPLQQSFWKWVWARV